MPAGDPVLISLPNATFLLSDEVGVIIQSEERDVTSKLKEIMSAAAGRVVGYVFYDFVANISFSAIVNGTSGLAAAQPGVALVLANDLGIGGAKNGVSGGAIYTKDLKISHQAEDLRMVSGQAFQRAGIA